MTPYGERLAGRAADLRRAFDQSFAEARREQVVELESLLAIRVAGDPYGLRLGELTGLHACPRVTPLPTGVSSLLGIAGFRGILVPVYDLRVLLGYPQAGSPRWVALAHEESSAVGLAFDALEGQLRVARDAITLRSGGAPATFVREVVSADAVVRPVVHVPSVLDVITQRMRDGVAQKER